MNAVRGICAVVPVKEFTQAKQRLAALLTPTQRHALALAMYEDVLTALAAVPQLAGILVITIDRQAAGLAARFGACVSDANARDGHTGATAGAARLLAAEGLGMIQVPADIPLVQPADIKDVLAAHRDFTIVPARDDKGSNTVVCSPADVVPLRFGVDSFFSHLDAARAHGIAPRVIRKARIGLDIDGPEDLALFAETPSATRTYALLQRWRMAEARQQARTLAG